MKKKSAKGVIRAKYLKSIFYKNVLIKLVDLKNLQKWPHSLAACGTILIFEIVPRRMSVAVFVSFWVSFKNILYTYNRI